MFEGIPPTPDPGFVKRLHDFDPKLEVQFFRQWGRFVIVKPRAYGPAWQILPIEGEDGQFRQPDERDIRLLFYGDLWRHGGVKERVRAGEDHALGQQAKDDKRAETELHEASMDDKRQIRKAYRQALNDGKANSEFERVDIKSKGLTAAQIQAARSTGRDPWAESKVG